MPAFRVPEYELQSVFELPLVVLLGALCGLAAAAFKASSQVRAYKLLLTAAHACRSIHLHACLVRLHSQLTDGH